MDLPSRPLGWVGTVTIGPLVTVVLENRFSWVKKDLRRFVMSEDNGTFCGSTVSPVVVGGVKRINLPGVEGFEGRVTRVMTDFRDPSVLGYKRTLLESIV